MYGYIVSANRSTQMWNQDFMYGYLFQKVYLRGQIGLPTQLRKPCSSFKSYLSLQSKCFNFEAKWYVCWPHLHDNAQNALLTHSYFMEGLMHSRLENKPRSCGNTSAYDFNTSPPIHVQKISLLKWIVVTGNQTNLSSVFTRN